MGQLQVIFVSFLFPRSGGQKNTWKNNGWRVSIFEESVDLENWGILEIPSKGIKSPRNGRKEGKKEGREAEREEGGKEKKKQGRGREGRKKAASKEGRKHLAPNYWGLIFWRGDQQWTRHLRWSLPGLSSLPYPHLLFPSSWQSPEKVDRVEILQTRILE